MKSLVTLAVVFGVVAGAFLFQNLEQQKTEIARLKINGAKAVPQYLMKQKINVKILNVGENFIGGCVGKTGQIWINQKQAIKLNDADLQQMIIHTDLECKPKA